MAKAAKPKNQEPLALPKSEGEYKELKRKLPKIDNATILKLTQLSFQAFRVDGKNGLNKRFMNACLDECHDRKLDPPLAHRY